MLHDLKLNIAFCDAIYYGLKPFEIRKNDRGYQTGDHIRFTPVSKRGSVYDYPTHPILNEEYEITYVLSGWGIQPDYVALGIAPLEEE